MSDLTTKDSEQDKQLSVLEYQVSNLERRIEMVHQRIGDTNDVKHCAKEHVRMKCGLQALGQSLLRQHSS